MFTQLCDNTETTLGGNILCGKIAFICVPAEGTPVGDSIMTDKSATLAYGDPKLAF
jgi:hypothetical protein